MRNNEIIKAILHEIATVDKSCIRKIEFSGSGDIKITTTDAELVIIPRDQYLNSEPKVMNRRKGDRLYSRNAIIDRNEKILDMAARGCSTVEIAHTLNVNGLLVNHIVNGAIIDFVKRDGVNQDVIGFAKDGVAVEDICAMTGLDATTVQDVIERELSIKFRDSEIIRMWNDDNGITDIANNVDISEDRIYDILKTNGLLN